jgi:hypothetical protein
MPAKKNIKATQVVKDVDAILSYHEEEPTVVEESTVQEEPPVEEETKKSSVKKKSAKKVIVEPAVEEPIEENEPVAIEENEPDVYDRAFNDISDEILNIIQGLTKDRTLSATAFNKIKTSLNTPEIKKNVRTICETHFPQRPVVVPVEVVAEKVKAEKKPRRKSEKDSSVPKKALSAYILFCNANRDDIKKENPEMKFVDITRELGSRWNNLSAKDKQVYTDLHDKDVERYQKEIESSGVQVQPPAKKSTKEKVEKPKKEAVEKKPKDVKTSSTEPKRGMSAYIYFCKEMRPVVKDEIPDIASNEILKELGRRWQLLSDEDKKPYNDMASAGKVEKKVEEKKTEVKKSKKTPVVVEEEEEEEVSEEELEDEE